MLFYSCFANKYKTDLYYNDDIPAEQVYFWLNQINEPDKEILSRTKINKLNKKNYRKKYMDHPLSEVQYKKGSIIRRHLLYNLQWIRRFKKFDKNNKRINGRKFYCKMRKIVNLKQISKSIRVRFGIIIQPTYLRAFPTDIMVMQKLNDYPFDVLQFSFLDTGEPIALYHISRDKRWGYVLSTHNGGWIRLKDIGWTYKKKKIKEFLYTASFIMALNWDVPIYSDESGDIIFNTIHMGSRLPLLKKNDKYFEVKLPDRNIKGRLIFKKGFIKNDEKISLKYLKITPRNIAKQSFKMMGKPYSWGGRKFNTDCSYFIKVVFKTMGMELPRNSYAQVRSLKSLRVTKRNKYHLMDSIMPFQTLLYLSDPSHVMLYIGEYENQHYVIHNKWSYKEIINKEEKETFIKKTIVSDLSLGKNSSEGSLFKRISRIGYIQ